MRKGGFGITRMVAAELPDRLSRTKTVSDAIMVLVRQAGVTRIYGAPGTTELSLVQSAGRYGVKYHFTLHDTIAVGMADGSARYSGHLAVANVHASQGLLNAAGFIRVALRDNVPLLILVGAPATTYDICEPNHFTSNLHQCVVPISKWQWVLSNADTLNEVFSRAISIALAQPRGPTVVLIPQDLLEKEHRYPELRLHASPDLDSRSSPNAAMVDEAARKLLAARKVVIFAGAGSQHETKRVEAIADLLGAPVIAEALDRGPQIQSVYCEAGSPFFLGFFDVRDREIRKFIRGSDLIFFIGGRTTYPRVIGDLRDVQTIVQLDADPTQIGKRHRVDIALVGDIGLALHALYDRIQAEIHHRHLAKGLGRRRESLIKLIQSLRQVETPQSAATDLAESPISGMQLVRALNESLPSKTIIVDDSQCMGYYLKKYRPFVLARTLFGSLASHLGWALPASLGIKQDGGLQQVVCIVGDGSLMFSVQALAAAAVYRIAVLIIVVNNQGFTSLKKEVAVKGRLSQKMEHILSLNDPPFDFVALAKAFGIPGRRIKAAASLAKAIKTGLQAVSTGSMPYLINVAMSGDWKDWDEAWYVPQRHDLRDRRSFVKET